MIEADGETCRYFRKNTDSYKVSMPLARWLFEHARDYDLIRILHCFRSPPPWPPVPRDGQGCRTWFVHWERLADYGMTHRRPWLKRVSMALIEGPILRHAAAVHFTSEMERNEAMALGIGLRAAVVPLAAHAPSRTTSALCAPVPCQFQLSGRNLDQAAEGYRQGRVASRRTYPGFIVTNMSRPAERVVAFYNKRGTCEQWIKEGKGAIKWTRLSCRTFAANAVRCKRAGKTRTLMLVGDSSGESR